MNPSSRPTQECTDWPAELEAHWDWMHQIAASRLDDPHAADDIMQEVSLSVVRQNGHPTEPERIRPWLYRIVIRRVTDHLRKQYSQQNLINGFATQRPLTDVLPDDAWNWVMAAEQREVLGRALDRLGDEDRQLFILKYVENWSYARLASQFGVSDRVIEYRLTRAKQQLRLEAQLANIKQD